MRHSPSGRCISSGAALDVSQSCWSGSASKATPLALADELGRGLRARFLPCSPPPGIDTSIVAFRNPTKTAAIARTVLDRASARVSLRENGSQIRVSPALFNSSNDIRRFLDLADELKVHGR